VKSVYTRKISGEEAREGYIMILKNWLGFFPPRGQEFRILSQGEDREVRVESYPCQCRGPERPHEHYFIRWPGLRAGEKIGITRLSEGRYVLAHETKAPGLWPGAVFSE
jgi:hypothetical protein